MYFSATSFKSSFPKAVAATRSPLPNAISVIFRPSPLELPVMNHTFFIFLCLLSVLQIYWRYRPPALLKSSIDFVIQLKNKRPSLLRWEGLCAPDGISALHAALFPILLRGSYPKPLHRLWRRRAFSFIRFCEQARTATKQKRPSQLRWEGLCAPDGNRTRTRLSANRILSPARLPVPPPGLNSKQKIPPAKVIRLANGILS